MTYFDAHCHLQDERIVESVEAVMADYRRLGVSRAVVNGTKEDDWVRVAELADAHPKIRPSFGLHPWFVSEAQDGWRERLEGLWNRYPGSCVGEIGLDRWIEGHDLDAQREAFEWQFAFAQRENRPVAIHCLKAWGALQESLRSGRTPERGFLLHSYGGSAEMVKAFAKLGSYFSISGYFAHERKESQREALQSVPLDRLLVETDAPDMLGPEVYREAGYEKDNGLNHPANIVGNYRFVAELFGLELEELAERVAENFRTFFGEA